MVKDKIPENDFFTNSTGDVRYFVSKILIASSPFFQGEHSIRSSERKFPGVC